MLTASHSPIAAGPSIPPEIPEDRIHLSYRAQSEINRGDVPCVHPVHVAAPLMDVRVCYYVQQFE